MHRLDADAEDLRDLPVRLSGRHKMSALKLAPAEIGMLAGGWIVMDPARGPEGMRTDLLGAKQALNGKLAAALHGERAGTAWFAGHIGRDRVARTNAVAAAAVQDFLVPNG